MTKTDEAVLHEKRFLSERRIVVALERRLRCCGNVITLGVKPNFSDYSQSEAALIQGASKVYYPSRLYAELFEAMGKKIFPSHSNYIYAQDKIKQTALFQLLGIPHPRTRVFYGKKQKLRILDYFALPLIAKIPRGSAMGRGVFLIKTPADLERYCRLTHIAYVQEYFPIKRDIRVVVIGSQVVHAYIRVPQAHEFRTNLAQGAKLSFDKIPLGALELARRTALACGWDDVGIDICEYQNELYVLEANMKYGKQGFHLAGLNYFQLMESLIDHGKI